MIDNKLFKTYNKNLIYNTLFEIINSVNEGVNVVDSNGILIYSNKISGEYVKKSSEEMIGKHISEFYPQAALINVLKTGKNINFENVIHENGQIYNVRAFPIFENNTLLGGYAVFTDITEITKLNDRINELEQEANLLVDNDVFSKIIGWDISLKDTIIRAKKSIGALGGPRHSIITGESGTGKTLLAKAIYEYAKYIGVIGKNAPYIEVNCAQFTNPDIAAMEVFGSTFGAYTDSKDKKGLFEMADNGILFLDEAHALDTYQSMLLKVIESGKVRRIGGVKDFKVKVIIIAASTKKLNEVLIPELYQRLAQNELYLTPLRERTDLEKFALMNLFKKEYEESASKIYNVSLDVKISNEAQKLLLNGVYPRNIRQFRDVINSSIDSAVPLINPDMEKEIKTIVNVENIPIYTKIKRDDQNETLKNKILNLIEDEEIIDNLIIELTNSGYGARKIANILMKHNIKLEYYQIAYKQKVFREKGIL